MSKSALRRAFSDSPARVADDLVLGEDVMGGLGAAGAAEQFVQREHGVVGRMIGVVAGRAVGGRVGGAWGLSGRVGSRSHAAAQNTKSGRADPRKRRVMSTP